MTDTEPTESSQKLVWVKVEGGPSDAERVRDALEDGLPDGYRGVVSDDRLELLDADEVREILEGL